MHSTTRVGSLVATAGLLLGSLALALPADAHQKGIHDNCTNLHEQWPHGVGRRNAVDKTSGDPVTNFKRSNEKYRRAVNHNSDLDRDGDKIACEQH